MSMTLTASKFNELQTDLVRTMLLLHSWGIWRARRNGWCDLRECRQREVSQLLRAVEVDIRKVVGREAPKKPLLGEKSCHTLFVKWVPDLVARVCVD